eukprot:XP_011661734.1 PREDICTED: coiled-coil domain-containing protein 34-like [Strongylocentrotus purpuratus]
MLAIHQSSVGYYIPNRPAAATFHDSTIGRAPPSPENYGEWRSKKKAAKEMKEKKEKEEQRAEAEAERREEEAEDAYLNLKWKEEAKTRPFPLATQCGFPQGSVKGELWRMEEQKEGCKRDEGEEGEGRTKS